MARTPNDDRSDSKNPTSDAYWANEANHAHQTGRDDDDDEPAHAQPTHATQVTGWVEPVPSAPVRLLDVFGGACVVHEPEVRSVQGLRLRCLFMEKHRETTINVDSHSIEAATAEALLRWEKGDLAYLALYDEDTLFLEKSQLAPMSSDVARELAALGELEQLIEIADRNLNAYKMQLATLTQRRDGQFVDRSLQLLGSWSAAGTVLRAERAEKLAGLAARGHAIAPDAIQASVQAGKCHQQVTACAQLVRDYQAGKLRGDGMWHVLEAMRTPSKISAL